MIVRVPAASRSVRRGDRPDNPLRPRGITECFIRSHCPWFIEQERVRREKDRERAAARRPDLRPQVFTRDGGRCVDCGRVHDDWQADHVNPLVEGGAHALDNMATRCTTDHRTKTAQEARARSRRYYNGALR